MRVPVTHRLRRARIFFKTTAVVVIVAFLGLYLQPLAIAAHLPKHKSTSTVPKESTDEEKLANTLEKIEKKLERLEAKLAQAQDASLEKSDLKTLHKQLIALDKKAMVNFEKIEQHLKDKKLPRVILDRHYDAVATYKAELKTLRNNLDAVETATTDRQRRTRAYKAKEHLRKKQKKRTHQIFDPNNLPLRSPEGRMRRHKTSQHDYGSAEFKTEPVQVASTQLLPGLLVSMLLAAAPTPDDLAETLEVPLTQEIQDLATELGGTPVALHEFVRNSFVFEPYAGSVKGALLTLRERGGNDWDLASLLIALFRTSGIPARYVVGTVEIPIDRAMSWLGVEDPNMAGNLLASLGRQTALVHQGGQITAVRTEHVWVRAFVPFEHHRGAIAGPGDTWIDVDPSFKLQEATQVLTLSNVPTFDQTIYLSASRSESPLEFYKTQLQSFLDANAPDHVPEALARNLEIISESFGVLVGQLPYKTISVAAAHTEVPDSARQKFTLEVTDQLGTPTLTYTAPLAAIVEKRLTLSYAPATQNDADTIASFGDIYSTPSYLVSLKPVVKLEGLSVAEGDAIGSGQEQQLTFQFQTPLGTDVVQNTIVAGEYYAIALNAQKGSGSHGEVLDRTQSLSTIQDTIDFSDPATLDERLGELLYLSGALYHQNLNMADRENAALSGVVDIREVSEIMYFLTTKVDFFFGVPRGITPVSITADLDRNTHLVIPIDGDNSRIKAFMQLEGNQSSFLEHAATEKVYESEALSAVKGIQLASSQGILVRTVTGQNIATLLPTLQVSQEIKTDITNAVNQGWEAIVPERNLVVQDWTGVGYILQNPVNGEGFYRINGGFGGAILVAFAILLDFVATNLSIFGTRVRDGVRRRLVCYPGADNILFIGDDTCYTEVTIKEAQVEDTCKQTDTACLTRYAFPNAGFERPLVDINEHGLGAHLTKHVTARQWRSQDFRNGPEARFMRAGFAVLTAVERLMKVFGSTAHGIETRNGSGCRSKFRNDFLRKNTPRKPSKTSHHMDGVAADIILKGKDPSDPKAKEPTKEEVLCAADGIIGSNGEVLAEDTANSVHISVRGKTRRDTGSKKFQWPRCSI